MTFDDDFVQIGMVRATLKSLGMEWPPPPFINIDNHGELPDLLVKRVRCSEITEALPLRERRVFVMATLQGKSFTDIAAALGISRARVERRMTKALVACRRRLEAR